jgi:hypothetical protein
MSAPGSLEDFCRYVLDYEEGRYADDPVRLGDLFREYIGTDATPSTKESVKLVRSLGIKIEAVNYLNTGGINMTAKGFWHVHYSAKDRTATQKFTIYHELFEVIHKNLNLYNPNCVLLKEPQISRYADRFAAAALIPPSFFRKQVITAGCDLVNLSEALELSQQCILIAIGQHFAEIPLIGALYEYRPGGATGTNTEIKDFVATVVVKTPGARRIKYLCGLQTVPVRNSHPQVGSLICAAVNSSHSVLWRSKQNENSPVVLVRPLLSIGREPYRVILLAIPNEEFGMISAQIDRIEPIIVSGDVACPSMGKCRNKDGCIW